MSLWHHKKITDVLSELKTTPSGISDAEASARLEKYGPNKIKDARKTTALQIFLNQFKSPIVWILIAAFVISLVLKEMVDSGVIGAIIVLNAVLGFVQEFRAEKAIDALKKLLSLKAKVLRNKEEMEIPAEQIVPGDILLLETGDKISADARLTESINLETQEASLTGESTPVAKEIGVLGAHISIADQSNMVFSSTIITRGRAKAVVVETGMGTQIGRIASLIQQTPQSQTTLQKHLASLGKFLGIVVVIIAVITFLVGISTGKDAYTMFFAAIALAVAAIPEGLPAVVTVALALGVQKMAKSNALVRSLPAVETLGACTVICTDKTGTLTHNEMTVTQLYVNGSFVAVSGSGYDANGDFGGNSEHFKRLMEIGALNNNSKLRKENNEWKVFGDPTEAALLVSAKKAGISIEDLQKKFKRISEMEFTSERKRMTTIHEHAGKKIALTKGAAEVVLSLCDRINVNGKIERLTKQRKEEILSATEKMAGRALRVLAFAYKDDPSGNLEETMVFVGLQGMIDSPREEAREAIEKCKSAGIKVIMITGDHLLTAKAVGKMLGISGKAVTGVELDHLSSLSDNVEDISIYARVNPEHKLKIIDALKQKGHIVAMTGDGVNDAPALKKADLGIAMGIAGTDVAKEASAMVLADDNFASIVNAVEEGRRIFDNIKKFVEYLLSSNMGEVLTVFTGILIGMPLPVTALQILWINLVTDGAPALALGVEPAEPDIMKRKPRMISERIVNKKRTISIFVIGIIMMLGTLGIFHWASFDNLAYAQTMAFTTLMMFQMANVVNQRSETSSIFKIRFFSNKLLLLAIGISIALQFAVVYVPFLQNLFGTVALSAMDWVYSVITSLSVIVVSEFLKFVWK